MAVAVTPVGAERGGATTPASNPATHLQEEQEFQWTLSQSRFFADTQSGQGKIAAVFHAEMLEGDTKVGK